jgi:hypothetical protein
MCYIVSQLKAVRTKSPTTAPNKTRERALNNKTRQPALVLCVQKSELFAHHLQTLHQTFALETQSTKWHIDRTWQFKINGRCHAAISHRC